MTRAIIARCSRCKQKEIIAIQKPRVCVWCVRADDVPPRDYSCGGGAK